MTISKSYVEFHKITRLGCPWRVLGGPWEVLGGALGRPWGPRRSQRAPQDVGKFNKKNQKKSYVRPSNDDGKTNEISTLS